MDKIIEKYINDLNNNLLDLPHDERQDVIEFYQEFLFDGNFSSEKEIIKDLGTPKQLARMILADYSVSKDVPQPDMHEKPSSKTNLKTIWLILLGILAAPVGIPLGLSNVFFDDCGSSCILRNFCCRCSDYCWLICIGSFHPVKNLWITF